MLWKYLSSLCNDLQIEVIRIMGACQPRPHHKPLDLAQWDALPDGCSGRRVLRNRFTGREIEEHSVLLSEQQVSHYYDVFNWRLGSDCLVNALNYRITETKNQCGLAHTLLLYVERVRERLHAYRRLSQEDAVYALQVALQGFQEVFKKFGYVDVEEAMFCINNHQQLKIWLSEDLACHKPWSPYMGHRTEAAMVRSILSIIDSKMGKTHTLRDFMSSVADTLKFEEAKFLLLTFMKLRSIQQQYSLKFANYNPKSLNSFQEGASTDYKDSFSHVLNNIKSQDRILILSSVQKTDPKSSSTNFHSPMKQHFTTACTTNGHLRQPSTPTVVDSQQFRKNSTGQTNPTVEGAEKVGMEAVLSGIFSPIQLSSILENQKEPKRSSVVIPKLQFSRKNSEVKRQPIVTFMQHRTPTAKSPSRATPKASSKQFFVGNSQKMSIKNLKKQLTPQDIKMQLNKIRRTYSICVTSRRALVPPESQIRYHASELVQPHQNQIISYEYVTSEGETDEEQRGSKESKLT